MVDIVSGNNGASLGSVGFAPGKVGTAWSFDGLTNRVLLGDPLNLAFTNSFSIEGWIWVNGLQPPSQAAMILYRGDSRYCQDPYYLDIPASGAVRFHVEDAQQTVPCGVNLDTSPLPMQQWVHVAAVFDADSASMQLYTNGQLAAHTNTPVRPFQDLMGGGTAIGGADASQSGYNFNGLIDELSVYDRALTSSEVQALYGASGAGKCASPIPPSIIVQPTTQTAITGSTVSFGVIAAGTSPLSYQWQKDGSALSGASSNTLTISHLQLSDAGAYSVIVTNSAGTIVSSNAVLTVNSPPPCVTPPAVLLAWWKGDGNANDSVAGNNGTLQSGAGFAAGEVGQAFVFNGSGQWVQIPDAPTLNPTNSLTLETWVYLSANPNNDLTIVVSKQNLSVTEYEIETHYANGRLNFRPVITTVPTGYTYFDGTNSIQLNTWYHLALTYDGTTMKFYVNGALDGSIVANGPIVATPDPVKIGGFGSGPWNLNGLVDEVSLYGRALSGSEVQAIYQAGSSGKCETPTAPFVFVSPTNQTVVVGSTATFSIAAGGTQPLSYQWSLAGTQLAGATNAQLVLTNVQTSQAGAYSVLITNTVGSITVSNVILTVNAPPPCTPPPSGLVSWWQAEGDVVDRVSGNNGMLTNGATFGAGEVGQGFSFNGVSSYVEVPNSPSLSFTNDFSIELWYKDNGLGAGAYGGLIAKRPYSGPCNFGLSIIGGTPATLLVYFLDPNHGDYQGMYYNNVPTAGVFHHVAATFHQADTNQIELKAYIDGQLVQTATFQANLARTVNNAPVDIGASNFSGEFFKGIIDEVSIYGKLLSDSEVAAIYAAASKGKCATPIPAHVAVQPGGQSVVIGQTATLIANGAGTPPLSYQWFFKGDPITDATNGVLVLANVQMSQAGDYSFEVTNAYGSDVSSNATLVVNFPPASVMAVSTAGMAGQLVTVPVILVANGNENAVGFSLTFAPNLLTNAGVTLGPGATNAALQVNTNQSGSVGIAIALSSGATFGPGTQELAEVSFYTAGSFNPVSIPLNFSDQPTKRELVDINAKLLAVNFTGGQVQLARSLFEGDVTPRPDGDGSVTIADWVQVGRCVAGLDSPTNGSEFQRADCAPRSTLGDGVLTVSDWVQAGRYAAGLDPLIASGGPTQPTTSAVVFNNVSKKGTDPGRVLSIQAPSSFQGQTATATVTLGAQGDENAIGFSLGFDPAMVAYAGASLGSDASMATIDINDKLATNGHVGVILALPTSVGFSPGTRQVLKVNFRVLIPNPVDAPITMIDSPVVREVADTNALRVTAAFLNGTISVNPEPSLAVAQSNQSITLAWPSWATNYSLQQAIGTQPFSNWTNLSISPVPTNNNLNVTVPLGASSQFYRLQHQ